MKDIKLYGFKIDIRKEGMFRIPGRMTEILEMKISFEQGYFCYFK